MLHLECRMTKIRLTLTSYVQPEAPHTTKYQSIQYEEISANTMKHASNTACKYLTYCLVPSRPRKNKTYNN